MRFKTSTQLKNAYMSALIAEGKVSGIKSGRGGEGKAKKVKTVGVGKRGSIVIAKDLVDSLGFLLRENRAADWHPLIAVRLACAG
jgi:hypothetical protein